MIRYVYKSYCVWYSKGGIAPRLYHDLSDVTMSLSFIVFVFSLYAIFLEQYKPIDEVMSFLVFPRFLTFLVVYVFIKKWSAMYIGLDEFEYEKLRNIKEPESLLHQITAILLILGIPGFYFLASHISDIGGISVFFGRL